MSKTLSIETILVARDFSPISNNALYGAVDLARRTGASLHLMYADVLHEAGFAEPGVTDAEVDADDIRKRLARDSKGNPLIRPDEAIDMHTIVRRDIAPAPAILAEAEEIDADILVLGTHGRRGLRRMLLGSVAEEVVRRADRPVLTVRGREEDASDALRDVRRILVPVDFSKYSRDGLEVARHWALVYGASIDVVHVIEENLPPAYYVGGVGSVYDLQPDIEDRARTALAEFVDETEGPDVDIDLHIRHGRAAKEIAALAKDADLTIAPTHGQTGLERFLLGSVTEKVLRQVACPVLTVQSFGKSLLTSSPTTEEATS